MADTTHKLRVMVDANVLVAGLGWPRWPYAVLQHAALGDYQLVLSPYIIGEAHRHLQRIIPNALPSFQDFLELCDCEIVPDPSIEMVVQNLLSVRDPKDIPVALAAIDANIDCLVSSDKDLTHNETLQAQLNVLLPAVFLRDYMGWSSQELEAIRHRTWDELV